MRNSVGYMVTMASGCRWLEETFYNYLCVLGIEMVLTLWRQVMPRGSVDLLYRKMAQGLSLFSELVVAAGDWKREKRPHCRSSVEKGWCDGGGENTETVWQGC